MGFSCYRCKAELSLPQGAVSISAECDNCHSDVHCCLNCKFHDPKAYNECAETNAERVVDKEKRNRCDYFSLRSGQAGVVNDATSSKAKALAALDALFKK